MKFFWSHDDDQQVQDENQIDYSYLSDDELLDSFRSENWGSLDEDHRVAIVQEMENRNAEVQGREPATVVSMNDERYYGQYNSMNNQLSIDVTNYSSYETLDTYVHETNHAYQQFAIEHGVGEYDDHTISMMQAEMARDENGNLYNYARTSPEYDMQCDELDSNNKAATYLLAEKERYRDDSEYRSYIKERAEHFEEVNNSLENDFQARVALQQNQAEVAWIRGDITDEQYQTLTQNINNTEYVDETVQQSHDVGDEIIALNQEFEEEENMSSEEENDYLGNLEDSEEENKEDYLGIEDDEEISSIPEITNDNEETINYD